MQGQLQGLAQGSVFDDHKCATHATDDEGRLARRLPWPVRRFSEAIDQLVRPDPRGAGASTFFAWIAIWRLTENMSVQFEQATQPCNMCGAEVIELRRGRCWGCYTRWAESRAVGRGATCTICQEKRRDQLKLIEIHGRTLPFCHACAARTARIDPVPTTLEGIRQALRRERRQADRRTGAADHRIFPRERRVGERREKVRDSFDDTDPNICLADFDEVIIELDDADLELVEQTEVRERHPPPR